MKQFNRLKKQTRDSAHVQKWKRQQRDEQTRTEFRNPYQKKKGDTNEATDN